MTDQQHHSISPPRELVLQWASESLFMAQNIRVAATQDLCNRAAQWGYDQRGEVNEAELQKVRDEELEACCEWLDYNCPSVGAHHLRNDRRPSPKPPETIEVDGFTYRLVE